MINKINFCGTVTAASNVKDAIQTKDLKAIQSYADRLDVDVFVYNKDSIIDGFGTYQTIVNKDGDVWMKTFDMEEPERSYIQVIPKRPDYVTNRIIK